MSNWERHGTRDMSLSKWHRQMLRQRAASAAEGEECGMIDIDWLEFCSRCRTNLFLVEAARDILKLNKVAYHTAKLAVAANIPAYIVLYTPTGDDCPADRRCRRDDCMHGISEFRIRQIAPAEAGGEWRSETPEAFADFVLEIHRAHRSIVCGSRFAQSPAELEVHIADPPWPDGEWEDVVTRRPPDWKGGAA